jgi:serine/threonine-protein kinase
MRRFQVTNREYLRFLDELVATGREAAALRYAPRELEVQGGQQGAMIYGRRPDGGFKLMPDTEGDLWELDYPVMMVDWNGAMAFAAHESHRSRMDWRLPGELEWEKCARGVDGRFYPWGDHHDPSWCCMRYSHEGRQLPAVVDSFPVDESPYGIRGLAGNMRDWCIEEHQPAGPATIGSRLTIPTAESQGRVRQNAERALRGGSWRFHARYSRASFRNWDSPSLRNHFVGLRILRVMSTGHTMG